MKSVAYNIHRLYIVYSLSSKSYFILNKLNKVLIPFQMISFQVQYEFGFNRGSSESNFKDSGSGYTLVASLIRQLQSIVINFYQSIAIIQHKNGTELPFLCYICGYFYNTGKNRNTERNFRYTSHSV